jgi:hypothetical protein
MPNWLNNYWAELAVLKGPFCASNSFLVKMASFLGVNTSFSEINSDSLGH